MRFAEIPSRLIQLQQSPDPIVINHVIVNDPEDPNKTLCYDIEVEVVSIEIITYLFYELPVGNVIMSSGCNFLKIVFCDSP